MARYIKWALAAILLVLVWQHSHWAIALAVTVLFVDSEFTNHLTTLAFSDLFLYSSEFWRVSLLGPEAAARLVLAKQLYDIASKERFEALDSYHSSLELYAASIKSQPDVVPTAVQEAKSYWQVAEEKVNRAYENLRAAGGK